MSSGIVSHILIIYLATYDISKNRTTSPQPKPSPLALGHSISILAMSITSKLTLLFLLFSLVPASPSQLTIQPALSSPPATIPAFPEQSALASGCPLDLPTTFFKTVSLSCKSPLRRSHCCPTLAAWLYSVYAPTALSVTSTFYDLPVPPDDSETCVGNIEKVMEERGLKLARPNDTCDLVYCYCGIRLHPLRCPQGGELVRDEKFVKKLEKECRGGGGIGTCNNCLHTLYQLKQNKYAMTNKTEANALRTMQNKDCELMGLTWLLAKNRSAHIHTVTSVLRALMMNKDDQNLPHSCSIGSDGLPMAVDSSEIKGESSSRTVHFEMILWVISLQMLYLVAFVGLPFH